MSRQSRHESDVSKSGLQQPESDPGRRSENERLARIWYGIGGAQEEETIHPEPPATSPPGKDPEHVSPIDEAEIERLHAIYKEARAEEDSKVADEIEQAAAAAAELLGEDQEGASTEEEGDIHEVAAERAGIRPELWVKAIEAMEQDKAASLDEALRNAGVGSRQRNRFFKSLGQERARRKAGQQELAVEEPADLSVYKELPNAEERAKRRRQMAGLMKEALESGDYDQFFRNPANRIRAGELGIKLPPLDPHGSNGSFSA